MILLNKTSKHHEGQNPKPKKIIKNFKEKEKLFNIRRMIVSLDMMAQDK